MFYHFKGNVMKKLFNISTFKSLALLTLLLFSGYIFAVPVDCNPITKNNNACFTTTLYSVKANSMGTFTIVMKVAVDGSSGGAQGTGCQALSHYAVQVTIGSATNVSYQFTSPQGSFGGSDPVIGGIGNSQSFSTGFKFINPSNIGDNHAAAFTFTYTLTELQDQLFAAKAGNYGNEVLFTKAEFQRILDCGANLSGPTANTDNARIPVNTSIPITVLSNDVPGSGAIIISSVTLFPGSQTNPELGTFTVDPTTGIVTFAANGTAGTTTISYQITDINNKVSTSTISVEIYKGPTAVNDATTTPLNTPVDITVLSNDIAGSTPIDVTKVTLGSQPASSVGAFIVNATTGVVTFTPALNYAGPATISYSIKDANGLTSTATISVTVLPKGPTAVNDATTTPLNTPVDITVLSNDIAGSTPIDVTSVTLLSSTQSPASSGSFTVNHTTGVVTFTPASGFTGTATINYTIKDGNNLTSTATISVTIETSLTNDFPATGFGTLAFEDLWPSRGDYDLNDLVLDYRFHVTTNSANLVEKVVGTFVIKAFGATLENGFGFQLPAAIKSNDLTVSGSSLTDGFINLNSNGTESGQTKSTIIVYDNAFKQMASPGGIGVNTDPNQPYVQPKTITITINVTPNKYSLNDLDILNFNPFLIVNKVRGVEVHLPDYPPTSLADRSLLGTGDDNSNPSLYKYYKTANNLPWAINYYTQFDYPIEKVDIIQVYLHFAEWATSGGTLYKDWYKNYSGYRNASLIYQVPQ